MNKELSEFVARVAFKNASELSKLIPIINDNSDEAMAKEIVKSIIKVTELITVDVVLKIYDEYPEIRDVFKNTVEKFGKLP